MIIHLVEVIDLEAPFQPTITQGDIMSNGELATEELVEMLPKGEELRLGHYQINDDKTRAEYLGTEWPEHLLR